MFCEYASALMYWYLSIVTTLAEPDIIWLEFQNFEKCNQSKKTE